MSASFPSRPPTEFHLRQLPGAGVGRSRCDGDCRRKGRRSQFRTNCSCGYFGRNGAEGADCAGEARCAPCVLNLFAYTGGARRELAACAAGAETTHVDSVKQVVTWSRENMELSGLDGIRWIVEDALKFVRREVRRGSRYNGIILDPRRTAAALTAKNGFGRQYL